MLNAQQKFKTTPAGEIPVDWECVRLGKSLDILTGFPFSSKTYSTSGQLLCRGDNVGVGKIKWDNAVRCDAVDTDTASKYAIEESDILLAMDRTWINEGVKMAVATSKDSGALLVQRVARLRCAHPKLATFFSAHFTAKRFEYFIKGSQQEGGGVPHISKAQIDSYFVPLPPPPEQQKIAETLGTWDRAIETQQKLIAALTQRKKALAQQLLTGKTRLPGFEEPWKTVKLGQLLKEVRRPVDWSDENTYNLLSVRRRSGGLFHRDSLKGSEIKTKIMKTTKAGDFLIAKMQVVHGALAATTAEFDGMHVSGSYVTLVPRKPNAFHMPFFNYLSQTPLIYHLALISSYGVIIEKMTFNLKWFLQCGIVFPATLPEQIAIARVLTTADRELALHTHHLTTLQTQKRALMQQLLTGKVRVSI